MTWPGKLRAPPLPQGHVPRPQLVRTLVHAMPLGPVVLASGDGFGKTTLLSEYAAQSSVPVAWVSLDAADDPQTVLVAAIESVASLVPGFGASALVAARTSSPQGLAMALQLAINDLEALSDPLVLVLDDVDALRHGLAAGGLRRVLRYRPPHLRLALSTRDEDVVDSVRLEAGSGPALALRERDLAFTAEEVAAVVQARHGPSPPSRIDALHEQTGGWPAGVVLSVHRTTQSDGPAFDIRSLPVTQFLRRAILSWTPQDLGRFLLEVSLLGRVTPRLAAAATGASDAAVRLEDLQRRHILDPPVELDGPTWIVPPVVASFGRNELVQVDPDRAAEVALAAAWWLVGEGRFEQAVEVALVGGDDYEAARVLLRVHLALTTSGRSARVLAFAERMLASGPAVPELHLAAGWGALSSGQDERAEDHLRLAEAAGLRGQRGLFVVAEAHAARSHLRRRQGRFGEALDQVRRALAILEATEPDAEWLYADSVRTRGPLDLGMALFATGDLDGAVEAFTDVVSSPLPAAMRAIAHSYRSLIGWIEGQEDPEVDADLARLLQRRGDETPELADFVTALALAVQDDGEVGARQLCRAETINLAIGEPGAAALMCVARALRSGLGWPLDTPMCTRLSTDAPGPREDDPTALLDRARSIMADLPDPGVLPRVVDRVRGELGLLRPAEGYGEPLTDAERRVLRLLGSRLTEREIAAELHLSHNTVRTYRRRLYRKLGVSSRAAAVRAGRGLD